MDATDNPQGGPAPASPSTETGGAGSRREPGISRPLGDDSSFPQGSSRQPTTTAQVPDAVPTGSPASRQFVGTQRPAEQATAGARPAGAAKPAAPATATAKPTAGSGSGSPDPRPSERQPPTGPPEGDGDGDPPGDGDGKKRTWKTWLLRVAILAIVVVIAVLVVWYFNKDDGSVDDVVTDQPEAEEQAVDFCRHGGPASLDEVGVPRFSDQLEGRINPLWSGVAATDADAQMVLDGVVADLFSTDGDGCTPPGAAYWRLVRPVSIDAGRIGVDDFDSATRMAIYEEDADTAMAVAVETASQLSDCADPQFVYLTAEEAPVIYVAAYSADYDDVVFVRTPLPDGDELPDGSQGLKVLRCSFGKVEGAGGDYVNDVLISPTLRAIIYLDSPAGVEVVDIVPDEGEGGESRDLSDEDASEPDDETSAGEADASEPDDDASEAEDTSSSEDEQAAEADEDAAETDETQPESTEEDAAKQSEADEDQTLEDETSRTEKSEEGQQDDETKTEEGEQTEESTEATEAESETDETEGAEEDDEVSGEQVVGEESQEETDEGQPEGGSGDGCDGTCGESDTEPEKSGEGGEGSGDDCQEDCPGDGGGSGDDCEGEDCPGDGPGSGDDCVGSDCPGEGDDCEGDDCPGEGDCEGEDCPGDGEKIKEACPPGWILDPFGGCKSPDPGSDGF